MSLLVNGSLTYTPDADFSGVDSFTYRAYDGKEYSNTATVTITVNPVNDRPMAVNDQATTQRDEPVIISVLANDTDADEDPLSVSSVTQGNHGIVKINADNTLTFTPASGFVGSDTFTYTVNDGNDEEDTATVTVTVNESGAPEPHATGPISVEIVDAHPRQGSRLTESELVIGAGDTQVTNIGSLDVELDIAHSDKTQLYASLESAEGDVIVLRGSMIDPPLAAEYTDIGFVGQQLVGTWTLKLWDEVKGVVGTLNEWSITVTSASPLLSEGAREASANDRTVLTQQDAGRIARAAMAMWDEQADCGGLSPD